MRAGDAASWLWPLLVAVVVLQVVLRYGFGQGSIMFEEIQWHIYAVGFMIGLSYCAEVDRHVRVDVLAERWSHRTRAWIELARTHRIHAAVRAGDRDRRRFPSPSRRGSFGEVSAAPGGLPYRWVAEVLHHHRLQSCCRWRPSRRISRCTTELFGFPAPLAANDER